MNKNPWPTIVFGLLMLIPVGIMFVCCLAYMLADKFFNRLNPFRNRWGNMDGDQAQQKGSN